MRKQLVAKDGLFGVLDRLLDFIGVEKGSSCCTHHCHTEPIWCVACCAAYASRSAALVGARDDAASSSAGKGESCSSERRRRRSSRAANLRAVCSCWCMFRNGPHIPMLQTGALTTWFLCVIRHIHHSGRKFQHRRYSCRHRKPARDLKLPGSLVVVRARAWTSATCAVLSAPMPWTSSLQASWQLRNLGISH